MSAPPGLAVERTVLAWTRTWLTTGVCGLLLLRLGSGSAPRGVAALLAGALSTLVVAAVGRRRAGYLHTLSALSRVEPAVRAAALTAGTAALLGLAAAGIIAAR